MTTEQFAEMLEAELECIKVLAASHARLLDLCKKWDLSLKAAKMIHSGGDSVHAGQGG